MYLYLALVILRHILLIMSVIRVVEKYMAQKIDFNLAPTEEVEAALGRQIEALRLAKNINQTKLAKSAGVSRRTITRLENGEGVSLDTLIRIMRALGVAGNLASLLPDPSVRPIERVRMKGRQRQRARTPSKSSASKKASDWAWGQDGGEE